MLRVHTNNIVIKGLLDTGVDVTIITPESWYLNQPIQEEDVQFLGIGTLSHVEQSIRWVECIGLEGQKGRLRLYLANVIVNL